MMNPTRWWCALAARFAIVGMAFVGPASAHPADISHLKVKVEPRRLELRLTFNLYTLQQFHPLDKDGDGRISKPELDSAENPLRAYLGEHVLITINGEDATLGEARRMERLWPVESVGGDVAAPDYAQRFVDFSFVHSSPTVIQDVWIGFSIFKETGELHVVQAVFEQGGKPAEVSFSQSEPDYTWETGFPQAPETPLVAPPSVTEAVEPKQHENRPLVIVVGIAALVGTCLLLGKVRRISRGAFRIGPPQE